MRTVLAASLASIHVHIFNPVESQLVWCKNNDISCSYENISSTIREINTYYACVRFVRIPEIFNPSTRIISLDCDGIAIRPISEEKFLKDTEISKVLWREKQQTSLASSVFFGPDNFRTTYADYLRSHFEKDTYAWYLDQGVMDNMIKSKEVTYTTNVEWGWYKNKGEILILTGKGSRKYDLEFQDLLSKYRNKG
jgi:hypothetical protein